MASTDFPATATAQAIGNGANSASILRYLTFAGVVFLALMLALKPDVGFTAPFAMRLLFWTLQIVTGLIVLQSVLYLLTRSYGASRAPSWALVLLSGLLGSVLLTPLYWLIGEGLVEGWLGYAARPDDEAADLAGLTLAHPLVREYLEIVAPVTTSWVLICLPRMHWLMPPLLHGKVRQCEAAGNPGARRAALDPSPDSGHVQAAVLPAQRPDTWRHRLPAELGTDVIAVTSELQYLRVWTPRGCALILGALADVEAQDAATGLRVHRSWWVSSDHLVAVRRTATGAVCLMSDGRHVPVSRRRRSEVLARFGGAAQYRFGVVSKAVADADLN
jgi:hypothetical protein